MGRYLVIENEPKLFELIQESVKSIDNNAEILNFTTALEFNAKLKELKEEEKPEFLKFSLYVINVGDRPPKEWKEIIEGVRSIGTNKEAQVCLTTYENKGASLNFLKSLNIFNVIFKPFDPLILKETIHLALQKGKLAKSLEMKSQKSSAFIGVLKEVELQAISELGFITISDAQIPKFGLTKYFSPLFAVGKKRSAWAQCISSEPHPDKSGHFLNKFQFFYAKKDFLNQIRKYVISMKPQEISSASWQLGVGKPLGKNIKIGFIGMHDIETDSFYKEIQNRFKNLDLEFLDCEKMDTWPKVSDHNIVLNSTELQMELIKTHFKDGTSFLWTPKSEIKEETLKELVAGGYREIFPAPLDRSYFYKKLKVHASELIPKEEMHLSSVSCHEIIKAANTIKLSEVNEVYINFLYSRELEMHSFREFIFITGNEENAIEIPAFCHFKEKAQNVQAGDKNIFFHQFVFYAMTDHFQKEIRVWLLQNYIQQNKKE